jgi:hypothetical protein
MCGNSVFLSLLVSLVPNAKHLTLKDKDKDKDKGKDKAKAKDKDKDKDKDKGQDGGSSPRARPLQIAEK